MLNIETTSSEHLVAASSQHQQQQRGDLLKNNKEEENNSDFGEGDMANQPEEIDLDPHNFNETDNLVNKVPEIGFPRSNSFVGSASIGSCNSTEYFLKHGVYGSTYSVTLEDSQRHCHTKDLTRLADVKVAKRKLVIASIVCLLFMIAEFVGGYLSRSLAIMTDAAHLLSDFGSFMISLFALWLSSRKPSKKLSFGWYRAEVMGALVSVLIIWVLTGVLVYEAILRVKSSDFTIDPVIMLITSGVGVVVNIILGVTLHGSGHGHSHGFGGHGHSHGGNSHGHGDTRNGGEEEHNTTSDSAETEQLLKGTKSKLKKDLNVRAAFIHVIGDFVQSIGVFSAALLIYFKPAWKIADPICTFLFSVLVLFTTLNILRDILLVLMEGTPKGLDFKNVFEDLQNIRAVKMVHNLHIWSLTMGTAALSVHLAVDETRSTQSVLREAQRLISKKYEIHHSTIQVERFHNQMENCSLCEEPKD